MPTTIEDFRRVWDKAEREAGRRIVRVTVHPDDYRVLAMNANFDHVTNPMLPTQSTGRGLWMGATVYVDPRVESGIAYVVTRDSNEPGPDRGTPYRLGEPPEPERRTAWARVLEDDLV